MLLIAVAVTAGFALLAAQLLQIHPVVAFVSYIPGAIETVATVTLAAGMNVAFILSHHLMRLVILHALPVFLSRNPPR